MGKGGGVRYGVIYGQGVRYMAGGEIWAGAGGEKWAGGEIRGEILTGGEIWAGGEIWDEM